MVSRKYRKITVDKEYTGSLVTLLQDRTDFVRNNSKKAWRKVSDGRIEMPDNPDRAVHEGLVNALINLKGKGPAARYVIFDGLSDN